MRTGDGVIATVCKSSASDTDKAFQPQLWMYDKVSRLLAYKT